MNPSRNDAPPLSPGTQALGIGKNWFPGKEYGFLRIENHADIFVHRTNLRGGLRRLEVGRRYRFKVGTTLDARIQAVNVEAMP
jgi:cold shock CspA family protein